MDPQFLGAVMAVGMGVGIAGGKLIDNLWAYMANGKRHGNSKTEMLLERLVKLAEEDQKSTSRQSEALRTLLREMEQHSARESKANEDIFKLLRKE